MKASDCSVYIWHLGFPGDGFTDEMVSIAQHAEELGFHSIGLAHAPVAPPMDDVAGQVRGAGPEFAWYHLDALAVIPVLLHQTTRIKVGFNVLLPSSWHPFHWAKYLASLDEMSGGRVIAGFGAGVAFPWGEKDATTPSLEKLGTSSRARGKRADEALDVMLQLWGTDGPITHHGEFYTVDDAALTTRCVSDPHPELWWAGEAQPSITRAARYNCDFLEVLWPGAETIRDTIAPKLAAANAEFGSDVKIADMILAEVLDDGADVAEIEKLYARPFAPDTQAVGSPEECATVVRRLRDAGVDHLVLDLHRHGAAPIEHTHDQMEAWVAKVLPLVGERGAS